VLLGLGAAAIVAAVAAAPAPASASIEIVMTVEGSRGPIGSADPGAVPAMKVTAVQVDLGPSVPGPLVGPKPVVVTRPVDELSGPLADEVALDDRLRVVITTVRSAPVTGMPQRRVIRLFGARILTLHAAMDATSASRSELGFETLVFTYERIEVEDDGLRVFTSGA
jgi:hypothetical protein